MQSIARALARHARIEPHLAAPAASAAQSSHGDVDRHDGAPARVAACQTKLGGNGLTAPPLTEKAIARPLDEIGRRGKVDRRLVGETAIGRFDGPVIAQVHHAMIVHSSIVAQRLGTGPSLVKNAG